MVPLLTDLGLRIPLVVAPMAGGPTTPELVGVSSESGTLGSLGAAYLQPADITKQIAAIRAITSKPFAVNLFVPNPLDSVDAASVDAAVTATRTFRDAWGLKPPHVAPPFDIPFDAQFEAVIAARPGALSFVFGMLGAEYIRAAREHGIRVFGAATSVDEALQMDASGVDAITLQGFEAGGHRAIFDRTVDDSNVGTVALVEQCGARIKKPLIAAGGLMNRADIQRVMAAGASAVQMGTAFLCCTESGTSPPYRRALLRKERSTKLTRAFSGRLARSIENRFVREMHGKAILPFPAQNNFTRDIRGASAAHDSDECLSLWCGTGKGDLWTGSAGDLISALFD